MKLTRIRLILITFLIATLMLATACTTQYTLSTSVSPSGGGTISPASGIYDDGSEVTLVATPESGWSFAVWSGDAAGTTNQITITIDSDKSVTARFKAPPTAQISLNPTTVRVGDEVTFSAEGSTDLDNNIVSYDWDFGDGKKASGMTVTHNYSQWGSYTVILVVMDSDVLANGAWVNILAVLGVIKVEVTESDDMICYSPYSDQDDIVRRLESQGFAAYDGSGDYDARLVINCEATESGSYGGLEDILPIYHGTKLHYTIKLYRGSTLLYENAMDAATSAIVDCGGDSMTNYCLCEDAVNNLKTEFEDSFAEMIEILQAALSS